MYFLPVLPNSSHPKYTSDRERVNGQRGVNMRIKKKCSEKFHGYPFWDASQDGYPPVLDVHRGTGRCCAPPKNCQNTHFTELIHNLRFLGHLGSLHPPSEVYIHPWYPLVLGRAQWFSGVIMIRKNRKQLLLNHHESLLSIYFIIQNPTTQE